MMRECPEIRGMMEMELAREGSPPASRRGEKRRQVAAVQGAGQIKRVAGVETKLFFKEVHPLV
jgi:hypothetical protein